MIENQGYFGNYVEDTTHCIWFTTCDKSGASVAYSGGSVVIYRGDNTVETTEGISVTSVLTGLYRIDLVLTNEFYQPNFDYKIVLKNATLDSETINAPLGSFSIDNRT